VARAGQVFLAQYGPWSSGLAAHTLGCVYAGVPEEAAQAAECHVVVTRRTIALCLGVSIESSF